MKILILPSMCVPDTGSPVTIARNLAALFHLNGHDTAVAAARKSRFTEVSFYPSPTPVKTRRIRGRYGTMCEEYLEDHGAMNHSYLVRDYRSIEEAIKGFEPDVIFEIERPAAIAAAVNYDIPLFSVVSPAAFRNREFRVSSMNGLNEFLSTVGMEQVLRFRDLYRFSRCIAFGPAQYLSFPKAFHVRTFGMSCITPLPVESDARLSIVISESSLSARRSRQIIEASFQGAPYEVYIHARRMKQGKSGNLHYLQPARLNGVPGSRVCIHDGTDAVTQYCTALGIPQVIVHDSSWQRLYNGTLLRRTGAGLPIDQKELSMEKLYETYRMVTADDAFTEHARLLQEEVTREGDLSDVLNLLK